MALEDGDEVEGAGGIAGFGKGDGEVIEELAVGFKAVIGEVLAEIEEEGGVDGAAGAEEALDN